MVRVEKGKAAAESIWTYGRNPPGTRPEDVTRFDFGPRDCSVLDLGDGRKSTFAYRIDPGATPKTIDLLHRERPERPNELFSLGVYEIQGDRLQICFSSYSPSAVSGNLRPKSLKPAPESGDILFVLQRCTPSQDAALLDGNWTLATEVDDGRAVSPVEPEHQPYMFGNNFGTLHGLSIPAKGEKGSYWTSAVRAGYGGRSRRD